MSAIRPIAVLATVLVCVIAGAAAADEWRTVPDYGISLEVAAGDADALASRLEALAAEVQGLDAERAERWSAWLAGEDRVLELLAEQLALPQAMPPMHDTFAAVVKALGTPRDHLATPQRVRVWTRSRLRAYLHSGGSLAPFRFDPIRDGFVLDVVPTASIRHATEDAGGVAFEAQAVLCAEPVTTWPVLIDGRESLGATLERADALFLGVVYHEVAEILLVDAIGMKAEPFRRWYADGMANYLAALCLEETAGHDAAEAWRRLLPVERYEVLRGRIDLLRWPAANWSGGVPGAMAAACYAFATEEVCGLVERHGPHIVPRIHGRLRARSWNTASRLLRAIEDVTGEDMQARLESYGRAPDSPFSGVAVREVTMDRDPRGIRITLLSAAYEPPARIEARLKDSRTGEVIASDRHTIRSRLGHARLWLPIPEPTDARQLALEITSAGNVLFNGTALAR